MILRFGVGNWRSFRAYQELSLVATALKDDGPALLKPDGLGHSVLPAAAIYGANASGKSNFLSAIRFLDTLVRRSHKAGKADSTIPVETFRLDPAMAEQRTRFDIDFFFDGVRYQFVCELDSRRVHSEYLYAFPQKRRQLWYSREGDSFGFGKSLKGELRAIQSITRPNSLFLSAAVASNHEQLSAVSRFFSDSLVYADEDFIGPRIASFQKFLSDAGYKKRVVSFLRAADVGILDFERHVPEVTERDRAFMTGLNAFMRKFLESDEAAAAFKDDEDSFAEMRAKLLFTHKGAKGQAALDLDSESRGTRQYLGLLGPVLQALDGGHILLVDEITSSLHPLLSKRLISLFGSAEANSRGAQIIFTTHDTNLLDRQILRRDQVWFAEKSEEGESCIYPLSDIKTRRTDNIERGYLEGRFGAVPFLGNFDALIGGPNSTVITDVSAD